MKERIKNIQLDKALYFFIAITFIFFGIFIKMGFAVDSYATFTFSKYEFIDQFTTSGRFVVVLVGIILKSLNLKYETVYIISYISANICMIISMYKLYTITKDDINNKILKILIPILIILNAFSIELFMFIENGIMLFAVMMSVFAVGEIKKWLKSKKTKYLITTFIFMLLGNFSYQGVVGIFIAISVIYILKFSKNIKEFIINNIIVAFSYGIPAIIDYLLIKIFFSSSRVSRVSGQFDLIQSLKIILDETKTMITETYGILPEYFLEILIGLMCVLMLIQILVNKNTIKNKTIDILKIIYIIAAVTLASVAPQIMQDTKAIWLVARSTYSYASLFGILILYWNMNFKTNKFLVKGIMIAGMILIVVQFYRFMLLGVDRYKVNKMDYQITQKVISRINEYEEDTGNTVKNIAIYEDKSLSYSYYGIFSTGDINIRAYSKDWCIIYIIRYYSGRDLEKIEKDTEIEKKFKEKEWTDFENEQLVFEGDTLHFCKY